MKQINKKHLQIIEYEEFSKEIGEKYFQELESFAQNNPQILNYSKKKKLRATQYVGVIQTKSGFVLEILPKIAKNNNEKESKDIFIKMLKILKNSPFKNINKAPIKSDKFPLLEVFISMFLDEVDLIIKKGIKKDYISKNENQNFLKGKLKINEHIKRNITHKEKFFVEYDDYLSNRIENKLIKTTLKKLSKISQNFINQKRLREFLFVFNDIDEVYNIKSAFDKLTKNRDIKYYENTLNIAKIFLLNHSFIPLKGDNMAFGLFFDMNVLFENHVGNWFKKLDTKLKLQFNLGQLFINKSYRNLNPDIISNNEIFDTKWKYMFSEQNIKREDLFQMYIYLSKSNFETAYLIYPYIEYVDKIEPFEFEICNNQNIKKIEICFFDLKNDTLFQNLSFML